MDLVFALLYNVFTSIKEVGIVAVSDKQKEYVKKHQQEKLDDIKIRPPKGTKDRWRAVAEARGYKSMQQFIINTVEAAIADTPQEKTGD